MVFQSTRPVRGATAVSKQTISEGGVQSTRPVRGATIDAHDICVHLVFQSTRPVRGATSVELPLPFWKKVSIHAPRAGRD